MAWDQNHGLEAERFSHGPGCEQVAVMDRIEGPAQTKLGHAMDCQKWLPHAPEVNLTTRPAGHNPGPMNRTEWKTYRIGRIKGS